MQESQQLSYLSSVATNKGNNRYNDNKRKDAFWITSPPMWAFMGSAMAKARKLHVADGAIYRVVYKYANGKRIVNRTNWSEHTFQIEGDIDNAARKTLCEKANNLKRTYEMQISEDIIVKQFEATIKLYDDFQTFIKDSSELNDFCKALYCQNNIDYNINLLSLYRKIEMAIATAMHSTAKFGLHLMNLKRNMILWYISSKHLKESHNNDLLKTLSNEIGDCTITCGETLYPDQRKDY